MLDRPRRCVYAPLLLDVNILVFEGTRAYPSFSRYWDMIAKHTVTQFYVAPTDFRLLKRASDHHIHSDLPSLRVLGSVGEPIAEASGSGTTKGGPAVVPYRRRKCLPRLSLLGLQS